MNTLIRFQMILVSFVSMLLAYSIQTGNIPSIILNVSTIIIVLIFSYYE
jgi:hypothetical protein